MALSWKDLPFETLHSILSLLPPQDSTRTLYNCTLVCRGWRSAAEHHLYSNVKIDSLLKLLKFKSTISESNPNVAKLVKKVDLFARFPYKDAEKERLVCTLLSNLPHLQHFYSHESPCYVQIMDAILDGKLLDLKTLQEPGKHFSIHEYMTCALLLKDRLQNIYIDYVSGRYSRLEDRLYQFKKVDKISIKKETTDMIEELELISNRHAVLKELKASFEDIRPSTELTTPVIDLPSLYSPRTDVNSLEISFCNLKASDIAYFIHKYPKLKSLRLISECKLEDPLLLKQLVIYLGKLDCFFIGGIVSNVDMISDCIGSYWEGVPTENSRKLESICIELSNRRQHLPSLQLSKNVDLERKIAVRGRLSDTGLNKIIEKQGRFIEMMEVRFVRELQVRYLEMQTVETILEKFYTSIFDSCNNLKELRFISCDIKYGEDFRALKTLPTRRNLSLQKLDFIDCDVGTNALYTLFDGIFYINHLNFSSCKFLNVQNRANRLICIHLPSTAIGRLSIEDHTNPQSVPHMTLTVARAVNKTGTIRTNFYVYDSTFTKEMVFERVGKKKYDDKKYQFGTRIHLRCQSLGLGSLKVKNGKDWIHLR